MSGSLELLDIIDAVLQGVGFSDFGPNDIVEIVSTNLVIAIIRQLYHLVAGKSGTA